MKRSLRQLTESCLANLMLNRLDCVEKLPADALSCSPVKSASRRDHLKYDYALPAFPISRACLGIVLKFFLLKSKASSHAELKAELAAEFPCCHQPLIDLEIGLYFWSELVLAIDKIAQTLDAADLQRDMHEADEVLKAKWKSVSTDRVSSSATAANDPQVMKEKSDRLQRDGWPIPFFNYVQVREEFDSQVGDGKMNEDEANEKVKEREMDYKSNFDRGLARLIEHSVQKREEHKNRERETADRRLREKHKGQEMPDASQFPLGSREYNLARFNAENPPANHGNAFSRHGYKPDRYNNQPQQ